MNWMPGRGGLCAAGAALLAFAALLFAVPTPSAASTYTLAFTGTVTSTDIAFPKLGIARGDSVSGTLTINPLNETPNSTNSIANVFNQSSIAYTLSLTHGSLDLTLANTAAGSIESIAFPGQDAIIFQTYDPSSTHGLSLSYGSEGSLAPLTSLVGLPTSSSGLIAMLGGPSPSASGFYYVGNLGGSISFDIAFTTATTPIPAALPLFVSALGGLGFMGSRRRSKLRRS
jgi:hypothetical protein